MKKKMESREELVLRLEFKDCKKDFDTIETTIKNCTIPGKGKHAEEVMGIQPSFTLMNREYLNMKMELTRWIRSRDFLMNEKIDMNHGLYIRYYTRCVDEVEERVRLFVEIGLKQPSVDENNRIIYTQVGDTRVVDTRERYTVSEDKKHIKSRGRKRCLNQSDDESSE